LRGDKIKSNSTPKNKGEARKIGSGWNKKTLNTAFLLPRSREKSIGCVIGGVKTYKFLQSSKSNNQHHHEQKMTELASKQQTEIERLQKEMAKDDQSLDDNKSVDERNSNISGENDTKYTKDKTNDENGYHKMQLLVIKKNKADDFDDEDDEPEINAFRYIEEKVYRWIEVGKIKGVEHRYESDPTKNLTNELTNKNIWISPTKQYGKKVVTVEFYFTVVTKLTLKELIEEDLESLKQDNVRIKMKRTRDEHTKRIGFFVGTIINNASLEWYEKILLPMAGVEEGVAETRVEMVYEGNVKQLSLMVYSVQSEATAVDFKLRKMSAEERTHIKYVSFKNNNSNERVSGVKLNQMINTTLKFEWLEEVNLLDQARYHGKTMTISQVLMNARVDGIKLLNGIEQGRGKYRSRLYIFYKPNMRQAVEGWFQENYGKGFKIQHKDMYKTSIREVTKEEKAINKTNTDYIIERIKEIEIEEKSVKSYAEAVKQNLKPSTDVDMNDVNSDDETCVASNKSNRSQLSADTITEASGSTQQQKMQIQIEGIQKQLNETRAENKSILQVNESIMQYIYELEDSIVSLAESEVGSKEHEKATKRVKEVKKKIKKRKKLVEQTQTENEEHQPKKRTTPVKILQRRENEQVETRKENEKDYQKQSQKDDYTKDDIDKNE